MAERSLSMREAPGSIPGLSTVAVKCTRIKDFIQRSILSLDMNGAHEQLFLCPLCNILLGMAYFL